MGEDGGPQRGVRYLAHHGYLEHSGYLAAFAQTHLKFIRGYEKGFARDQVHPGPLGAPLAAVIEAIHDLPLALPDLGHVYGDGPSCRP